MIKTAFNENWRCNGAAVTLPHDAMIREPRAAGNPSASAGAYFPGGVYTYEKAFTAPAEWAGKRVLLQFEGVYKSSIVKLNGELVGGAAYGYIPFFADMSAKLNCGAVNTITVIADNADQPNSRWYTGSGIYRPVWLWVGEKDGIAPGEVKITTLSYAPAKIRVDAPQDSVIEILDGDTVVASGSGELAVPDAKLWSDETPYLYTCRVTHGGDTVEELFGIRKIEWSPKGLFINGKQTLLRGGCIHHDNGILGAACHDESEWRRVRMMKAAGYNAIRSAHNPISRAMLEACDTLGMYVMDETWDMWYSRKSKFDYAIDFMENYRSDLDALVHRDYNHPSVIFYSIGNEVSEPATEKGVSLAADMIAHIKSIDTTRPVTGGFNLMIITGAAKGKGVYDDKDGGRKNDSEAKMQGMNSTMFNMITAMVGTGMNNAANSSVTDKIVTPLLDKLDICGYNYASGRYRKEGKRHPNWLIFGAETFPQDIAKNWAMVKQLPYLIGDFMWTAWDYLGETSLGTWAYTSDAKGFTKPYPWLLADTGAMDILGNPNGELLWAQAAWDILEAPAIAVQPVNHPGIVPAKGSWRGTNAIPFWSWKGCEGNRVTVEVYFDCAKLELILNGKSLGKKKVRGCRAVFKTTYAPGKLEAAAYNAAGKEIARSTLETAVQADVHLHPEKSAVRPGEILYIPVTIGDGRNVECNADKTLTVTVEGGTLLAFGSANPRTEELFHTGTYRTYYGHALAIVRAGNAGSMKITVGNVHAEVQITSAQTE